MTPKVSTNEPRSDIPRLPGARHERRFVDGWGGNVLAACSSSPCSGWRGGWAVSRSAALCITVEEPLDEAVMFAGLGLCALSAATLLLGVAGLYRPLLSPYSRSPRRYCARQPPSRDSSESVPPCAPGGRRGAIPPRRSSPSLPPRPGSSRCRRRSSTTRSSITSPSRISICCAAASSICRTSSTPTFPCTPRCSTCSASSSEVRVSPGS